MEDILGMNIYLRSCSHCGQMWDTALGASSVYGTLMKRTNDIILFEMRNLGSWMLNNDCFKNNRKLDDKKTSWSSFKRRLISKNYEMAHTDRITKTVMDIDI